MNLQTSLLALVAMTCASLAQADIALTPTDIHNNDTTTANYVDSFLTLTPQVGGIDDTFSGSPDFLGIDEQGTNNNAFNDPDTTPGNENDETLLFNFAATAGLSSISYNFSRADGPGPNDGVVITGFLSDPNVTFSVSNPNLFAVYNAVAGSVRLNIPGSLFGNVVTSIDFNPNASRGQSLVMSVNDTTQAGAQFAIRGMAYSVPEPSSMSVLCLGMLAAVSRRRRGTN